MTTKFSGSDSIILLSGDSIVPYGFYFAPASSASANDGAIPYGETVASCVVTAYSAETDAAVTSQMVGSTSVADNIVTVPMTYPATSGVGRYYLKFVVTTSGGESIVFTFSRVIAKDLN